MTDTSKYLSPLVSCLECRAVKSAKGIFSHFISSHTEEGKENMIKAGKASSHDTQKQKAINIRLNYSKNPNLCICGNPKQYKIRNNKFCSHSCAAIHTNLNRDKSIKCGPSKFVGPKLPKLQKDRHTRTRKTKEKLEFIKISWCCVCNKCFPGDRKTCSKECYLKKLSTIAKLNPALGGNKNNKAYGWYESKFAGKVWLESSYEYKIAVDLDLNNINWTRPSYLKYGTKKYFADFYLVEQDVYLDPKNDYLISIDTEKISRVMEENNVIVHILNKHQLSWEYIQTLL